MATTRQNGKASAGKVLRMPKRTIQIKLEGDYEGFYVEMWSNPPLRTFMEVQNTTDFIELQEKLKGLIISWNLTDYDGNLLPTGQLEDLSVEVLGLIINGYLAEVTRAAEVPKG